MYWNTSSGPVAAPKITPLRDPLLGLTTTKIDTGTYIELLTDTQGAKLFFSVDGSKPNPFHPKIGGKEVTHKYIGPFTLKPGKRLLKALAVSRDGLHESQVVSKTFVVEEKVENSDDENDPLWADDGLSTAVDDSFDCDKPPVGFSHLDQYRVPTKPIVKSKVKNAWTKPPAASHTRDDGHINPINYSGTQVNIFGIPPQASSSTPSLSQVDKRGVAFSTYPSSPYNSVPYLDTYRSNTGYFTEQMIKNLEHGGPLHVSDVKNQIATEERLAIEYPPIQKKKLSPGKGLWRQQVDHIYSNLLEYAKEAGDFRHELGMKRLGQVVSAALEEDEDTYHFIVTLAKADKDVQQTPKLTLRPETPLKVEKPTLSKPAKVVMHTNKVKSKMNEFINEEEVQREGTVKAFKGFDAEQDAEALQQAMKGLGTDEDTIIQVMATRSNKQRQDIIKTYKTMFGKGLISELESELSGNLCATVLALCEPRVHFDATQLHKAIKGLGTDENTLIEVLCTRSNKEIKDICTVYKQLFGRSLEKDIADDTSGHFKRFLISLVQGNRDESNLVNKTKAREDAEAMYRAGENKFGTDESRFNVVLCSRSSAHLRATFEFYKSIAKKDIEDSISSEMSGNLKAAMLAVVRCIRDQPGYFAQQLHKSMKGAGTGDDTLIRIVVSRCEVDMVQIRYAFRKKYKQSLAQFIQDDTSGDYRKVLLMLIGEPVTLRPKYVASTTTNYDRVAENDSEDERDEDRHMPIDDGRRKSADSSTPKTRFIQEPEYEATGTIADYVNFNAESDAEILRKAMKGLGTNEKAIMNVYGRRASNQIQLVIQAYKTMFGKDLISDLKGELSGNFSTLVLALCFTKEKFDASELRKAVQGLGTKESVLIEILCTRTNKQISMISQSYKQMFGRDLEKDIKSDTSGHFQRLLVSMLQGNRDDNTSVNVDKAKEDAHALYEAGEKSWGMDESRFNAILASRSFAHLRVVFREYGTLSKKDIISAVKSEMSGDLQTSMLTIIKCIQNKPGYFAERLYHAMKGLGTDDDTLIRVIVSRCETDMVQIKAEFNKTYGKGGLGKWIMDDCSGDYRDLLLMLIGEK